MDRRLFIKSAALGLTSSDIWSLSPLNKTHIITLSFDDGFKKSFYKIADIFENFGLSACFNVIASGHFSSFQKIDHWILPELLGNFNDWNILKSRGHEVMPHSWKHMNLANQPLEKSKELITKCLDYFCYNLNGYDNKKAVFNFPFNSSTPELEEFTLSKVLAIRSSMISDYRQTNSNIFRKGCISHGPKNIDTWVDKEINSFLKTKSGWLIINAHGLDDEGWGPMSAYYLENLLRRLILINTLEILPTGYVLNRICNK